MNGICNPPPEPAADVTCPHCGITVLADDFVWDDGIWSTICRGCDREIMQEVEVD